jgi:hypothetical protein
MNAPQVYVTSAQAGGALFSLLAFFGVLAVRILYHHMIAEIMTRSGSGGSAALGQAGVTWSP